MRRTGCRHSGVLMTLALGMAILLAPVQLSGQNPPGQPGPPTPGQQTPTQSIGQVRPDYVLGPNDQILIRAPQAAEINERPVRVDADGFIDLPIVGRIKAGGLTVRSLEAELVNKLKEYIRDPQVYITLGQFRSEPVLFVGAFRAPGLYPLGGRRTLVEMLSSVGGTMPNASRRIRITRRAEYGTIPLPSAVVDPEKKISSVEISLESLMENVNPEEDILLEPYDLIRVDQAEKVYVSGEVGRPASIELGERSSISLTQALTEAGGMRETAKREQVRVLRLISGTNRRAEIIIDAKRVFEGKAKDFALLPSDVLYVPNAPTAAFLMRTGTGLVSSLPYILITAMVRR